MKYAKLGTCLFATVVTATALKYFGTTEPGRGPVAEHEAQLMEQKAGPGPLH